MQLRPPTQTTPEVLATIPGTGTATDIFQSVAAGSIAILRKRDGAEMAETALAVCSPTRSDPDGDTMHVEVDLDNTQVFELGGKRWKRDDVAKERKACLVCGRCREQSDH